MGMQRENRGIEGEGDSKMRRVLILLAAVAMIAAVAPASADERDVVGLLSQAANRYVPGPVGVPQDLHFVFGPYVIPPGQDSNRITVDLPVRDGFVTAIAPDLIDASSGRIPTQQEAHIHHAHWFRVTNDPNQEYYPGLSFGTMGGSWVFGTGEEKTQGRLDDRARVDKAAGNNWDYGIEVDGSTPNAMIYMIHNKLASVGRYFVILDVTFIPGTRAEIEAVTGRPLHPLYGQLWGQTKTVTGESPNIGATWKVTHDSVAIASGSHLHPGGKAVVVSNTGQDGRCSADLDRDGFPGVAILNSFKYDHDMRVWPYSEDFQMGASKFGWRAPLHKGDVLRQDATYALTPGSGGILDRTSRDSMAHNWYGAMSYTGIYMDREYNDPALQTPAGECSLAALAPRLLGDDTFAVQGNASAWGPLGATPEQVDEIAEDYNLFLDQAPATQPQAAAAHGMVNHVWRVSEDRCAQPGLDLTPRPGRVGEGNVLTPCGPADIATQEGPVVDTIQVAGFLYTPGDLGAGATPMLPRVRQGSTLTLVNEDAALNIRHTFTSCAWPCLGTYVTNFPLSNGGPGSFDTGKLGNVDPVDGGLTGADTVPVYSFPITPSKFATGKYAYYCMIHPFMRGGFEVVA